MKERAMNLKSAITEDMKNAMRSKDMNRLGTIRLLLAAIKQKEVDERIELTDTQVIVIVEKMIKQRKDSISQFTTAKRQDLVDQETSELLLLETYLPAQLSEVEILAKVKQTIEATGAVGPQDMGKVIGILKPELAGQADMGKVSALVKAALSGQPLRVYGDGSQSRSFCAVSDVVEALDSLMSNSESAGQAYNIGSTNEISIKDLAQKVIDITGSNSKIVFKKHSEVFGENFEEPVRRVPDISKISKAIGWQPKKNLESIILEVAEYIKANEV